MSEAFDRIACFALTTLVLGLAVDGCAVGHSANGKKDGYGPCPTPARTPDQNALIQIALEQYPERKDECPSVTEGPNRFGRYLDSSGIPAGQKADALPQGSDVTYWIVQFALRPPADPKFMNIGGGANVYIDKVSRKVVGIVRFQ